MHIDISLQDGVPIYRQIANQIKYLVASGQLGSGDELPPIRGLALQLRVTANTIVKAYDALEVEGIVVKRHGAGTFINDPTQRMTHQAQKKILSERADTLLVEAKQMNFTFDEVIELLRQRQDLLTGGSKQGAGKHVVQRG
ncbi:MAG: GntR family transcriptional regulator [Planctomycetales bacterium]|nr:GntR family transcriptional regulator [Planctomycetales bacterium]